MEWLKPGSDSEILLKLREIMHEFPEIEGTAVVTADGLPIAAVLPEGFTEDRLELVSVACAGFASIGSNLAHQVERGAIDALLYIRGISGYVIIRALTSERLLVQLCGPQSSLGLIFLDGGLRGSPLSPTPEPIFPQRPPKTLVARAEPEYDDPE